MKKLILSLGLAGLSLTTFAQQTVTLYSGDANDLFNSDGYGFKGTMYKKDSTILGNKVVYLSATSSGYYAGGAGLSAYPETPIAQTFTGKVATSTLSFSAFTNNTNATLKVQFQAGENTWGHVYDLSAEKSIPATVSALLSDFNLNVNDAPTGPALTDADFATVTAIQFVIGNPTSVGGTATLFIDDLKLNDPNVVLGLASTSSSSEETVSAYDMLGNFVGTGKIKELGLESGKVYIVKSASQTRKIVMAK